MENSFPPLSEQMRLQINAFDPSLVYDFFAASRFEDDENEEFACGEDLELSRSSVVGFSADIPLQALYSAYRQGIFPWFSEEDGEDVIWWCPSPRFVLFPKDLHVPESLKKTLKKKPFTYTFDACFERVIRECAAAKRAGQDGTWIGEKIIESYTALHEVGFAHSVEAWSDGELAGGFYGVHLGGVFCGESMFTIKPNASKCAFVQFVRAFEKIGGKMIDSQVYTDNIARYGAKNISRTAFLRYEKDFFSAPLSADLGKTFVELSNQ
jgi:leucyl/phenylalanyl-tRNA--protein transferase